MTLILNLFIYLLRILFCDFREFCGERLNLRLRTLLELFELFLGVFNQLLIGLFLKN